MSAAQQVVASFLAGGGGGGGGGGPLDPYRYMSLLVSANNGDANYTSLAEWRLICEGVEVSAGQGGTAASSSQDGGGGAPGNAFDNNIATAAISASGSAEPYEITVDLGAAFAVDTYTIRAQDSSLQARAPADWTLRGSNTSQTGPWTTIDTRSGVTSWTSNEQKAFMIDATGTTLVTDGLVAKLDASDYSSGQTWANSETTPADGAGQTDYDYFLGATSGSESSDPTWNSAGSASYFSMDGGDWFTHTLAAGSMPAFLRAMHKAGSEFTVEIWMLWGGSAGSNIAPLFDSGTSDQGGSDMSRGVIVADLGSSIGTSNKHRSRVKQNNSGGTAFGIESTANIAGSTVVQLATAIKDGGIAYLWKSGDFDPTTVGPISPCTFTSPSTNDTANNSKIGARGDAAFRVPSGTRIYIVRVYNRILAPRELYSNWQADKGRFGL